MLDIKKYIVDSVQKLKDHPGTIFGLLYPYILVIVIGIGLHYISNLDNVAQQRVPPVLRDTLVISDLPEIPAKIIPPVDVFMIKNSGADLLVKGKELYITICASCHNTTGAGGGPAAIGLNPAPRNFTSPDGWKNGMKLSEIYTTLQDGIAGSSMISYDYLTPEERISIIHYIRTEFIANAPEITDDELTALDQTYNLSAGMSLPAQIPVSIAMEIMLEESLVNSVKVENGYNKIISNDDPAIHLFKRVTNNQKVVLSSFINSSNWRSSKDNFISFVSMNVNNGFNNNVLSLNESDWEQLYNLMLSII